MLDNKLHVLEKSEIDDAASLLAHSFSNSPLYQYVFGQDFSNFAKWYFSCLLKCYFTNREIKIICIGRPIKSICIYSLPSSKKVSLWGFAKAGYYQLPFRTSIQNIKRLMLISKLRNDHKKQAAFSNVNGIYVDILAVDPRYQGQGFGRQLFQYVANQVHQTHLMTETTNNVEFYKNLGCYLERKEQVARSSLLLYHMIYNNITLVS